MSPALFGGPVGCTVLACMQDWRKKRAPAPVVHPWEWRAAPRIPRRISRKHPFGTGCLLAQPMQIRERARRNPPSDSTVMQSLVAEEYQLKEKLELLLLRQKALISRLNALYCEWESQERLRLREQEHRPVHRGRPSSTSSAPPKKSPHAQLEAEYSAKFTALHSQLPSHTNPPPLRLERPAAVVAAPPPVLLAVTSAPLSPSHMQH